MFEKVCAGNHTIVEQKILGDTNYCILNTLAHRLYGQNFTQKEHNNPTIEIRTLDKTQFTGRANSISALLNDLKQDGFWEGKK